MSDLHVRNADGSFSPVAQYPYPPKSRGLYIVLGLFLGGLGIHNFYAGRLGCAVSQLLITLFIGWLIVPLLFVAAWVLIECLVVTEDGRNVRFA